MSGSDERGGGTVTLEVPTQDVETKAGRGGRVYHIARLPDGTRLHGRDLSGALVCSGSAHESAGLAGITEIELPAGSPKAVRVASGDGERVRYEQLEVDPAELRDATRDALDLGRELAMARQAVACLEAGDRLAAREACRALLEAGGGPLPPAERAAGAAEPHDAERADAARGYEAMGVLPAHLSVCSANTRSPGERVPERFAYVAFDEGRCVTREFFELLLEDARSRRPRHGGVLEEHSIGYVARQLRRPFARMHGRLVAEVNGVGVDFTDEVRAIPGTRRAPATGLAEARDVGGLGVASLAVDGAGLVSLLGMSADQADALCEWVHARVESDLAVGCERIGVANVSALLRSPDVVRLLVESGVRLENPTTGESMALDPGTGAVECDFAARAEGEGPPEDDAALMEWHCLRVASNDGWRVATGDALRIAFDEGGPMAELRAAARAAYLSDLWLTERGRLENVPTRERTRDLLARGYRLREECSSGVAPSPERGRVRTSSTRVA